VRGGWVNCLETTGYSIIPMMCIWYPDLMSGVVASTRSLVFRGDPIPDEGVSVFGWAMLVFPAAVALGAAAATHSGW